jgi:hypothetical protein
MPKTTLSELIISARLSNEKGNFDETRALCAQIFAQDTGNVAGLSSYMTATKIRPNDPVFARIEGFAKQTELPSDLLSQLHFMRGKGYGDMDKTDLAFEALIKANALKDVRFDPVALRRSAQRLIKAAKTAPTLRLPVATPRMVFIIRMPRSGTSLLAQALGAHSDVQNLGEQTALGAAMLDPVSERVSPLALLTSLTEERLIEVRDAYLSAIAPLRGAAPILIDKMPENYWLAFVIPMIFPDALIIHITRDRIATAWSCFRHDFKDGHAYSYDFAHCLAQYDLCKELTGAWKKRRGANGIAWPLVACAVIPNGRFQRSLANWALTGRTPACAHKIRKTPWQPYQNGRFAKGLILILQRDGRRINPSSQPNGVILSGKVGHDPTYVSSISQDHSTARLNSVRRGTNRWAKAPQSPP